MSLTGKTILITGAAGGLGRELALQCARLGADMVLLDKDRRGLGSLSDAMTGQGLASPGLYPLDLAGAGPADFDQLRQTVESEFGGLDALVHCALEFDGLRPLDQIDPHEWLKSMQVNVNAPWLLSCKLLPLMKKSHNGRLFFILDDIETVTGAYWGAYGTAKVALTGLVRQFADTLGDERIVVKGINPGPMRTAFRAKGYHAENPLDQPEPALAAARIANLLKSEMSDQDLMVDFSERP